MPLLYLRAHGAVIDHDALANCLKKRFHLRLVETESFCRFAPNRSGVTTMSLHRAPDAGGSAPLGPRRAPRRPINPGSRYLIPTILRATALVFSKPTIGPSDSLPDLRLSALICGHLLLPFPITGVPGPRRFCAGWGGITAIPRDYGDSAILLPSPGIPHHPSRSQFGVGLSILP